MFMQTQSEVQNIRLVDLLNKFNVGQFPEADVNVSVPLEVYLETFICVLSGSIENNIYNLKEVNNINEPTRYSGLSQNSIFMIHLIKYIVEGNNFDNANERNLNRHKEKGINVKNEKHFKEMVDYFLNYKIAVRIS